uniref:Uncharacterized protein n=1 Tax=viral metagenome TaxID=1070528 RepID=A0A6M3K0B2_9ZZZZ
MGESSTSSAICKVCFHRHRQGDPHIWDSGSKESKKADIIKDLRAVIGRSSSTVERPPCKRVVSGSIPGSGPKRPWGKPELRRYVRQPLSNSGSNSLTKSNILSNKPIMLESNRSKKSNILSNKESNTTLLESNKGFDKKAYQREYMAKRRAKV